MWHMQMDLLHGSHSLPSGQFFLCYHRYIFTNSIYYTLCYVDNWWVCLSHYVLSASTKEMNLEISWSSIYPLQRHTEKRHTSTLTLSTEKRNATDLIKNTKDHTNEDAISIMSIGTWMNESINEYVDTVNNLLALFRNLFIHLMILSVVPCELRIFEPLAVK